MKGKKIDLSLLIKEIFFKLISNVSNFFFNDLMFKIMQANTLIFDTSDTYQFEIDDKLTTMK